MWPVYLLGVIAFAPAILACFIKSKVGRGLLCAVSFFGFLLFAFLTAAFVLPGYIGIHSYWLPFVLCALIYMGFIFLVWKPFSVKTRRITVFSIAGVAVLLAIIFIAPAAYRQSIPRAGEEINLMAYSPFGNWWYVNGVLTYHESSVAKLNEESTLNLDGDLPRLDGATALYPLYSAFVRATYPAPEPNLDISEYQPYGDFRRDDIEPDHFLVICSRTAGAFENLIDGYADIIFLMGVSDEQRARAAERGLELVMTPIGHEAFVFFVNSRNQVTDLSTDDIRRIYSGEVTNWQEVGGTTSASGRNNAIRAYQRPDESGSQTMLKQIMGDTPLAPALLDEIFDTMMGMYERVANYRNYRNSLGYSFLYYIRDMIGENKVKFLSVDGIAPTHENIASGAYPFANNFYAITVKSGGDYLNPERTENIDKLLEWILSPQGQYLVEVTGYVPIN
jgi:phosphate transport system substrate-binding protein